MAESHYQARLIRRLKRVLPGCVVLKLDSGYLQGSPDLLILHGRDWAMLEVKASASEREQPNQRYYQQKYDEMSFCAFIYPENEEDVIRDLQQTFRVSRRSRVLKP
jgi:hypothetical protein